MFKAPNFKYRHNTLPSLSKQLEVKRKKCQNRCLSNFEYYTIVFGVAFAPPFGLSLKHPSPNSDEVDPQLRDSHYLINRALI